MRCAAMWCAVRCDELQCGEVRCGAVRCDVVACGVLRCAKVWCAALRCAKFSGIDLLYGTLLTQVGASKAPILQRINQGYSPRRMWSVSAKAVHALVVQSPGAEQSSGEWSVARGSGAPCRANERHEHATRQRDAAPPRHAAPPSLAESTVAKDSFTPHSSNSECNIFTSILSNKDFPLLKPFFLNFFI
ncbi:uncharacterized protein [Maniola hyperantus]|uniref:uncharacterized protein n=1 Tax=Aphantopus hyperantus TaxID=2795564 RepID=UPI003749CE60